MSDDPPRYTERQKAEAERQAFIAGWGAYYATETKGDVYTEAKRRYPLPKRVVPRVLTEKSEKYGPLTMAIVDGQYVFAYCSKIAWPHSVKNPLLFHIENGNECLADDFTLVCKMYLELLADPTVEEDAE